MMNPTDKQITLDLFDGVLIYLLTRDLTPELISLAERESSYPVRRTILPKTKKQGSKTEAHRSSQKLTEAFISVL